MSERIVVFDIEILNQSSSSICAIGIVELIDFKIQSTYYSLIRPKDLTVDPYRYKVHQIKSQSLKKERFFDQVWQEIAHYFENSIVVSHDIQVDMMYLRQTLQAYHIPYPSTLMSCTNVLSHFVYPQLKKYNLTTLAEMIGYSFHAHHALEDAKAAAHLLVHLLEKEGYSSLRAFHEDHHLEFGEMKKNYYRNMISPESAIQLAELTQKEDAYLYHQSVCFTGKLSLPKAILEEKTKMVSALPVHQVSSQTNYLVIGEKEYRKVRYGRRNKKVKKALSLMRQGQDLKIIREKEYVRLLNSKK